MYNQFDLCKQCDDEAAVYNGLCHTCLDSSTEGEDVFVGGSHIEKFTRRKPKSRKKYDTASEED